jgi:hypothetical protein
MGERGLGRELGARWRRVAWAGRCRCRFQWFVLQLQHRYVRHQSDWGGRERALGGPGNEQDAERAPSYELVGRAVSTRRENSGSC